MNRRRTAALVGLTLLAAPMVAGTAEAAVIVPPGNPMVGGSVACHFGVQTLRWWVSVTDHSGTVTAYASTGQTLHEGTGSFVVVGPESVTLVEDNKLAHETLESSATVVVPDASTCAVVTTTTTVPVTTTTVPVTTTTVPATSTTTKRPVVATTLPSPTPPATHVVVPPTAPPAGPAVVPAAHVAQAQPAVALPTTPAQLAETGSDSWRLVLLAGILLALGLALVSGATRRGRRTAK